MNASKFETLYHLTNADLDIIEIKRLDLPNTSDKALLFHWLLVKNQSSLERLIFEDASTEDTQQKRVFTQGKLSFSDTKGLFQTETRQTLTVKDPQKIPPYLADIITSYLS